MIASRVDRRTPYATEEEVHVTRMDTVRSAAEKTRDSVRATADAVAPYASTAKESAVSAAGEAGRRLAPLGPKIGAAARTQYDNLLAPRLDQALGAVPPGVQKAVQQAANDTAKQTRRAAGVAVPAVGKAVGTVRATAGPAAEEAVSRSAAVVAALRTGVTAKDIDKLARRKARRALTGKVALGVGVAGAVGGVGYAAWQWWNKQTTPDWLVDPATDGSPDAATVNGSGGAEGGSVSTGTVDGSPAASNGHTPPPTGPADGDTYP
jgi:hypothetical protein